MFKAVPLAAAFLLFLSVAAFAQDDSLHYDLGRILVKKSATQTTSISGSDLEKYQASNLSDAINVWLYGTYTQSGSITYVIDGNIISDVNAYSIYDVEEVTLIQTAVVQSAGVPPGQQMVLVKLRSKRDGKKGIEVNGQNSLVNLRNNSSIPGLSSNSSAYDQYYISGYRNYKKASIGVTAEYQRDVDPTLNGDGLEFLEPSHFDRFKLNAYANAQLGKHNTLMFTAGYVPQVTNQSYTQDTTVGVSPNAESENTFDKSHVSQHMINATFNLKSDISKSLSNRFSVAYNHYSYFENDSARIFLDTDTYINTARAMERSHNMLVRDYLYYHTKLDSMDFESTLNMTYRNFEDSIIYNKTSTFYEPNLPGSPVYGTSSSHIAYKTFMISPTVNLYYKDALNIQTGFVGLTDDGKAAGSTSSPGHIFPFFNFAFSPARLVGLTVIKCQIYASYARQSPVIADDYSTLASFNLIVPPGSVPYGLKDYNQFQQYNSYHLGSTAGITRNFSISYSYEYNNYTYYAQTRVIVDANGGAGIGFIPYNGRTVTSRFTLHYNLHTPKFTWNAMLTGAETNLQVTDNAVLAAAENTAYLDNGHRWSGGYTNRFVYQNYFAGVDFLYQLGARPDDLINAFPAATNFIAPSNNNSFTVQNIYFGTRIRIPHIKYIELYANGRNLLQNGSSNITDNRRYYGLGFKCGL